MTDRQQTGVWFVITGVLLLSLWVFSYVIVNWAINSGFVSLTGLSDEQSHVVGASGVAALQLISLTGIPFVITGLAQIFIGSKQTKRSTKR